MLSTGLHFASESTRPMPESAPVTTDFLSFNLFDPRYVVQTLLAPRVRSLSSGTQRWWKRSVQGLAQPRG